MNLNGTYIIKGWTQKRRKSRRLQPRHPMQAPVGVTWTRRTACGSEFRGNKIAMFDTRTEKSQNGPSLLRGPTSTTRFSTMKYAGAVA